MQRRNKLVLLFILIAFLITGCKKEEISAIKKEYEDLNGTYREVELSHDEIYDYVTEDQIEELINNKESFIVFYGSSKNNYTRSVINILSDECVYLGLKKVYYVNRENDIPVLSGYIDGLLSGTSMCVSGYQTSDDMELTEEIIKDSKTKINSVLSPVVTAINTCDVETGC